MKCPKCLLARLKPEHERWTPYPNMDLWKQGYRYYWCPVCDTRTMALYSRIDKDNGKFSLRVAK